MQKLFAFILILLLSILVQAQSENSNAADKNESVKQSDTNRAAAFAEIRKVPVTIPKISEPMTIDGKLDEAIWKQAAVFKDFFQTSPGYNLAPSKPTEVYVMYDEKNLYVGFKCWDEKDKIRATVAKRDDVFNEDNVRMWLDTYDDQRRAYVIGFNPLGIQQDGIFTEGQGADYSVDIVMESKGVIEDWGWSVEAKIPFKSLRYSAGKGKLWGFSVARNIDRLNDELDQWTPDDRNVSGLLVKHGKIGGLDGIKSERTLEIVPSVTLSETGERQRTAPLSTARNNGFDPIFNPFGFQDPSRFVNGGIKKDLGVNLKYTITPNVTLDAAVNPDYAEIEADAPVVQANQRFPIYFDEKRPFFLEGKDIFDSPLQPFYSRTIIDPDLAAKLTGKIGKDSFGLLVASDNAPGNYSKDEREDLRECQQSRLTGDPNRRCFIEEFLDKNALFSVLRLKHDIGKNNNVGFFATSRIFPHNRNFVGGFDGTFKLDPKTVLTFQVLGTHSRKNFYNPNEDSSAYRTGNGLGYYFNLDYTAKNYGWTIEANGRTQNYRADAGFTKRVNTNSILFGARLSTEPKPKAKLIRFSWQPFTRINYDWHGRSQNALLGNNYQFNFQKNLFVYAEFGVTYERLFEEEFGAKRSANITGAFFGAPERSGYQPYLSANINKNFGKKFSASGFVASSWNSFDFDFGAGNRYPRSSPAFVSYLSSPEYLDFLRLATINPNVSAPDAPPLDPGKGHQFDMEISGEYKPIDPFRISLDYTKSRLTRNDNGKTAFDSNIFSLRSTYQFSRFVFTRLRLDYDSLSSNVSGQALFGWNPNPGTAFYVGYNDNFNYNGFSPYTSQIEPGFARNSRTFFIRASYLFRKSF